MTFRGDIGAATLLALIGGTLYRRSEVLEVRPVISKENGSHEIVAVDITIAEGNYRVTVEPRD